jgi:hypothetical protein
MEELTHGDMTIKPADNGNYAKIAMASYLHLHTGSWVVYGPLTTADIWYTAGFCSEPQHPSKRLQGPLYKVVSPR